MIERNRNQSGRRWNIVFGVACLIDGLVRVGSLGYLHSNLPLAVSRLQTKAMFRKMKAKANQTQVSSKE